MQQARRTTDRRYACRRSDTPLPLIGSFLGSHRTAYMPPKLAFTAPYGFLAYGTVPKPVAGDAGCGDASNEPSFVGIGQGTAEIWPTNRLYTIGHVNTCVRTARAFLVFRKYLENETLHAFECRNEKVVFCGDAYSEPSITVLDGRMAEICSIVCFFRPSFRAPMV